MRRFGLSLRKAMLVKHHDHVKDLERIIIEAVGNQVVSIDVLVKFRIDEQEFELIIEGKFAKPGSRIANSIWSG